MSTLFELNNEFQMLYELATEEDDEQAFLDTVESLMGELEVKAAGYVNVINQLEMEAAKADLMVKQFKAKMDVRKNHIKRMKEALLSTMDSIGLIELPAGNYTIKIKKNGGMQPLDIPDPAAVPDNMTKITVEPDTAKIREYLKDHEVDWAQLLERGRHITIK